MKPLNLDNSPCSPISSNCVIWQGPDLACIKLCKGDTVSDVVAKLATELCDILDTLNINNYDLSCFNLTSCAPADFQALINFLIERICALENLPTPTPTPDGSGCPTDCFVTVASRLATSPNQVMNLVDYVNLLATTICNILTEIDIINASIINLDVRVTALENEPAPSFIIPSFVLSCDIGTIIPVLPSGSTEDIDVVLERFINEEWCPTKAALGSYTDISNAITSQSPCYDGTVTALQYQYTTSAIMQVAYPTYVAVPTTLADAVNNIWISLCDLRNAGKELSTVSAGNNVTVTPTTSVVGNNEVTDYEVNAKDTVVAAGDNITITSVTSPTDVTTYTVNGKEAIVAAGTGISVGAVTVGNDTTYTVTATGAEDTGWQPLDGFSYYSGVTPPQCRRIGNVIHFRGVLTVPLDNPTSPGNVVTYTSTSYNGVMSPTPFTGAPGGVVLNASGSLTFNNGSSVIPTSVLPALTNLDSTYRLFNQIGIRPIDVDASYGTVLSSVASISISSNKTLSISVLKDLEITNTRGLGVTGNSPLRFITSNVRAGEYLPDYTNAGTDVHNAPSNALFPLQSETFNLTWPFSCNAGEEDEVGGFSFILDGLIAYI